MIRHSEPTQAHWWTGEAIWHCSVTVASIVLGLWLGHCSFQLSQQGSDNHQNAGSAQADTVALPPLIDSPIRQQEPSDPARQGTDKSPCWHCSPMLIDVLTLIVITITAWAVYIQARETRKAADAALLNAKAAQASADAVKVVNRQWIRIDGWKGEMIEHAKIEMVEFRIHMMLTNESQLPMTVRAVRGAISGKKAGYEWFNRDLGPKEPMWAWISTLARPNDQFDGTVVVEGWAHFIDAFGDLQDQPFGKYLVFNHRIALRPATEPLFVSNVAGLKKSLADLATEWPLNEPTEYTQPQPKAEHKPNERKA